MARDVEMGLAAEPSSGNTMQFAGDIYYSETLCNEKYMHAGPDEVVETCTNDVVHATHNEQSSSITSLAIAGRRGVPSGGSHVEPAAGLWALEVFWHIGL